jgi:2'-5' RNA ligase
LSAAAQSGRARLFFALWPDAPVRTTLAALARDAQAECGGRATAPEKIHLTLFFVGDAERSRIEALEAAAASIASEPFELVLDRLGYWRHNRIVWAGASTCPSALIALASGLHGALARAGVKGEERPYVPHLTLVRNAARKPAAATSPPCTWHARAFVLVESVSVAGGVRYDVRSSWPL